MATILTHRTGLAPTRSWVTQGRRLLRAWRQADARHGLYELVQDQDQHSEYGCPSVEIAHGNGRS